MATFFKSGQTFDEQRNDPVNKLIGSGQYRDIPADVIRSYFSGAKSQEETLAAIQGTPLYDPSAGPIEAADPEKQKAQNLFEQSRIQSVGSDGTGKFFGKFKTIEEAQAAVDKLDVKTGDIPTRDSGISGAITKVLSPEPEPYKPPTPPNEEEMFSSLMDKFGVNQVMGELENVDKQIEEIRALEQSSQAEISGETVSSLVRSRKLAEVRRENAPALAQLLAQRKSITQQMSISNKMVTASMKYANLDWRNAFTEYNDSYSKYYQQFKANGSAQTHEEARALANFKFFMSTMQKSNLTWDDLSPDEQRTVAESAVESNSGAELLLFLQRKPKESITEKTTTEEGGTRKTSIVSTDQNGNKKVTHIYAPSKAGGATEDLSKTQKKTLERAFNLKDSDISSIIKYVQGGGDLEKIREWMRGNNIDPAALDWIMHYYDPIHNQKPGGDSESPAGL